MCLRAELISFFLQEEVVYNTNDNDRDFFFSVPKLKFCLDGKIECGIDTDNDEEEEDSCIDDDEQCAEFKDSKAASTNNKSGEK